MDEVIEVKDVPEVVTPVVPTLASMLEAPDDAIQEEVVETAEETEAKETLEIAEETLVEAVEKGASADEVSELRAMIREMRDANVELRIKLGKVEAVQKGDAGTEVPPQELEVLQNQFNDLADRRGESFTTLLEAMELNPKFEDVREVCSANNFNDIFESVAQQRGGDFSAELIKAKIEVWSQPNPYKYMYEVIKEYHPNYKVKTAPKAEVLPPTATAKEVLARTAKKLVDAPGTIAGLAGAQVENGGWTSAKIDAMPESALKTVPKAVYQQWLAGELD